MVSAMKFYSALLAREKIRRWKFARCKNVKVQYIIWNSNLENKTKTNILKAGVAGMIWANALLLAMVPLEQRHRQGFVLKIRLQKWRKDAMGQHREKSAAVKQLCVQVQILPYFFFKKNTFTIRSIRTGCSKSSIVNHLPLLTPFMESLSPSSSKVVPLHRTVQLYRFRGQSPQQALQGVWVPDFFCEPGRDEQLDRHCQGENLGKRYSIKRSGVQKMRSLPLESLLNDRQWKEQRLRLKWQIDGEKFILGRYVRM